MRIWCFYEWIAWNNLRVSFDTLEWIKEWKGIPKIIVRYTNYVWKGHPFELMIKSNNSIHQTQEWLFHSTTFSIFTSYFSLYFLSLVSHPPCNSTVSFNFLYLVSYSIVFLHFLDPLSHLLLLRFLTSLSSSILLVYFLTLQYHVTFFLSLVYSDSLILHSTYSFSTFSLCFHPLPYYFLFFIFHILWEFWDESTCAEST